MKKVIIAALLCAGASFASWNMFPVKPAGQGEVKAGFQYDMNMNMEKVSVMGLNLGARFSPIENLELAIMMQGGGSPTSGFLLSSSYDGDDLKTSGLNKPVIGVRYFMQETFGFFADVALPLGAKKVVGDDPELGLKIGAQYSAKLSGELEFGSEIAFYNIIEDNADLDMSLAGEVDYNLGVAIPLLNIALANLLGDEVLKLIVKPGVKVPFAEMFVADAAVAVCVAGDGCDVGATPITIGANVGVHF